MVIEQNEKNSARRHGIADGEMCKIGTNAKVSPSSRGISIRDRAKWPQTSTLGI